MACWFDEAGSGSWVLPIEPISPRMGRVREPGRAAQVTVRDLTEFLVTGFPEIRHYTHDVPALRSFLVLARGHGAQ